MKNISEIKEEILKKLIDRAMNVAYFEGLNDSDSVSFDKIVNEHKNIIINAIKEVNNEKD